MPGRIPEARCARYHADGTKCANLTRHADGWCRAPGCAGFTRRAPDVAPASQGAALGTRRHLAESSAVPVGLEPDDAYEVTVSQKANDSFRFHHGGSASAAEAQIRSMLEDFLVLSSRRVSPRGFVQLARDGYSLVLDPGATVVTEYATVHRERTWAQVRAGVPSRFGRRAGRRPQDGPVPERGAPMAPAEALAALEPATVYLSARARGSAERVLGLRGASDADLDAAVRDRLTGLAGNLATPAGSGRVEVTADGLRWLLSDDARVLIGVARAALSDRGHDRQVANAADPGRAG
jgi:hypothetical protein